MILILIIKYINHKMTLCNKRSSANDQFISVNSAINDFEKANLIAINTGISFTANITLFIALYNYLSINNSDDIKQAIMIADSDVISIKSDFDSVYIIRNSKYEVLKTTIRNFNTYIESNNDKYDINVYKTTKSRINSINKQIDVFNAVRNAIICNIASIRTY